MQSFYGRTIRDSKGDLLKISGEVWAILGHCSKTIEKPLYNECPRSPKSWWSCQRDKVLGRLTYMAPKYFFPEPVVKAVTPIFNSVSNKSSH